MIKLTTVFFSHNIIIIEVQKSDTERRLLKNVDIKHQLAQFSYTGTDLTKNSWFISVISLQKVKFGYYIHSLHTDWHIASAYFF